MKSVAIIASLFVLTSTAAQAQSKFPIIPPPEFDGPYKGELIITVVPTQEDVGRRCGGTQARRLGCAFPSPWKDKCEILIVPDKAFKGLDYTKAEIMRHELAHCNGWPGDHPGGQLRNGKLFKPEETASEKYWKHIEEVSKACGLKKYCTEQPAAKSDLNKLLFGK